MKKLITKLTTYIKKRNFTVSPEPKGDKKSISSTHPVFVIQKHQASHLHYDLRLEIDDVLVSWAVPKGPPLHYGEKHLAVLTEDHPLEYATFQGTIPPGSYGAGTVEIWDHGTYDNIKKLSIAECLKQGTIEIEFNGKRMHGTYALIRTHLHNSNKNWLFFKIKKKY